jgi:AcrR family transcriptional regulator
MNEATGDAEQRQIATRAAKSEERKETRNGQATREHIMDVALELFGHLGYRAVTVRQITEAADVNLSAITYHFGGKEELYRATVLKLMDSFDALIGPHLNDLLACAEHAKGSRAKLRAGAGDFATNWATRVLNNPDVHRRLPIIAMELAAPSPAFPIIYERFYKRLYSAFEPLVAASCDGGELAQRVRVHAAASLLLGFVAKKRVLWRSLDWTGYSAERVSGLTPHLVAAFTDALGLNSAQDPAPQS